MFKALLIDDNLESRLYFKKALFRLGCTVEEADSAELGLQKLSDTSFSFVLASIGDQTIGGRSIAQWIKVNRPETKFFLITGWRSELEQSVLPSDGIHGFIHKPLFFKEIRDVLIEHLG